MPCARCPYTQNYELLWRDDAAPAIIAVMLRCCAGPELQIRRGGDVLLSEIFTTPPAVMARAAELRATFVRAAPTSNSCVDGRPQESQNHA